MNILGIDIGGSGIKGATVNIKEGAFATERYRIPTPQPSVPESVVDVVAEIVQHFDYQGPIGCTFPAIIKNGVAHSASNVDKSWIGTDGKRLIQDKTGCQVRMINDGDAAGIAEMTFGAGKGQAGVVMILTLGTGIGSALFTNRQLVPNTEFGHLVLRGKIAEARAADRIRKNKNWSWKQWAKRVNEYLQYVEFLFSPDLFIIGGGVSKRHDKFFPHLNIQTEIVPALLLNDAGIIGAAMAANEEFVAQELSDG